MIRLGQTDPRYSFFERIVERARLFSDEEEWLEFKHNNEDPDQIGQYLSALGNAAALHEKDAGYLIYGINNATHEIEGTKFDPSTAKKGGESLENYLAHMLSPNARFVFYSLEIEDAHVIVGSIDKASFYPLSFAGTEYIRIGANKKKLREFPESERFLWRAISIERFELDPAARNLTIEGVTKLLDLSIYYALQGKPYPARLEDISVDLTRDHILKPQDDGRYIITNAGALSIGRDFGNFPSIQNKLIRVILHDGEYLTSFVGEKEFVKGYACCFEDIVDYIDERSGKKEIIDGAIRHSERPFPLLSIREMLGNAMIHQDLTSAGTYIIVHVFPSRIEISNPGKLLCDINRTIDAIPKVRNEILGNILRKMKIVEEQGSGYDRIEESCAKALVPSVLVQTDEDYTVAKLFARHGYREFDSADLIRTCYTFACLRHFNGLEVTNKAIRERFGIDERNAALASRILKATEETGKIKKASDSGTKKNARYVPYYASKDI